MKRNLAVLILAIAIAGCGGEKKTTENIQKAKAPAVDYTAKGFDFLKKGDVVSAIKSFDEAIRQDPQNPEKYNTLGEVYFQLKYYPGAISTLHAALKLDPMNAQAYYLLSASYHLQNLPEDRLKAVEAAKRSMQISLLKKDRASFEKAREIYMALMPGEELPAMSEAPASEQEMMPVQE